jgi:TIR domain
MSSLRGEGGIFISYRREDTAGEAGRLYDHLSSHFGADRVFMDVDSIAIGTDFTKAIVEAVSGCGILLALIGRHWSAVTDVKGIRRIDYPQDFVRVEIETALQRGIRVVPVLVDGAGLPQAADLPSSLRPLAVRQALQLSHTGFRAEVTRLITAIEDVLRPEPARSAGAPAPKVPQGVVTQQGSWRLALVADEGKKMTFRLSSGKETHHIAVKSGILKGTIEVDGQVAVRPTGLRPMHPYPLTSLSSAIGSEVTLRLTASPDMKSLNLRILTITVGSQVLRYQVGSPAAGGWRLELLADEGATKRLRLSSDRQSHDITLQLIFRGTDVIEVDGTREVADSCIRDKKFYLRNLGAKLGSDVTIYVKGGITYTRITVVDLQVGNHLLRYDTGRTL